MGCIGYTACGSPSGTASYHEPPAPSLYNVAGRCAGRCPAVTPARPAPASRNSHPNPSSFPYSNAHSAERPTTNMSDTQVKDKLLYLTRHAEGHHNVDNKNHSTFVLSQRISFFSLGPPPPISTATPLTPSPRCQAHRPRPRPSFPPPRPHARYIPTHRRATRLFDPAPTYEHCSTRLS